MVDLDLYLAPPEVIRKTIGANAKRKRKELKYTQEELAKMAGMALSSYRRFEQTGHVSLDRLIAIAISLDSIDELKGLFSKRSFRNIEELIAYEKRQGN